MCGLNLSSSHARRMIEAIGIMYEMVKLFSLPRLNMEHSPKHYITKME
jgi:hypothetical protein